MKKGTQYTEKDNVATCLADVYPGDCLQTGFCEVEAAQDVPVYHKIALRPIRQGEDVYKYGEVIGTATADISSGCHVHVHNMESRRDRGDRK